MLKNTLSKSPLFVSMTRQYDSLSLREKSYLKIMAVALFIGFLYFVVWLPSNNFLNDSKASMVSSQETLSYVRENLSTAAATAKSRNTGSGSMGSQAIVTKVSSVGKRYGVELKRFEPSGENRLRIWLEDVPFDGMVQWLETLAKKHQLKVSEISLDRDEKAGLVNARLLIGQ